MNAFVAFLVAILLDGSVVTMHRNDPNTGDVARFKNKAACEKVVAEDMPELKAQLTGQVKHFEVKCITEKQFRDLTGPSKGPGA